MNEESSMQNRNLSSTLRRDHYSAPHALSSMPSSSSLSSTPSVNDELVDEERLQDFIEEATPDALVEDQINLQLEGVPDGWSILVDDITIICHVGEADGCPGVAAAIIAATDRCISKEISPRDGSVVRQHGTMNLIHPSNGAVAKLWANKSRLMITVNPTKWIQGYAAFCPLDPHTVVQRTISEILAILWVPGMMLTPTHLSGFQITGMFDASTPRRARLILERIKSWARKGRAHVSTFSNSVYFGLSSSQRALKIYLDEDKDAYGCTNSAYMGRMNRAEGVYRNQIGCFGRSGRSWFDDFYATDLRKLLWDDLREIRCNVSPVAMEYIPEDLTNAELGAWTRWRNYGLPRLHREYRRLRNSILEKTGVDIFVPYSEDSDLVEEVSVDTFFRDNNVTDHDHRQGMACSQHSTHGFNQ